MNSKWLRRALVAVGVLALTAGCTVKQVPEGPNTTPIRKDFAAGACVMYTQKSMLALLNNALISSGWPKMAPKGTNASRISGHLQRCVYNFTPAHPKVDGAQDLAVYIYNELGNGAALMANCQNRPNKTVPGITLGSETCLDTEGQWRVRLDKLYFSVLIKAPNPVVRLDHPGSPLATGTFVAPEDDASRAVLGLAVAQDLAWRLG